MSDDATMARLDDQIGWYDKRSSFNQTRFKILKILVIVSAALIPLLSSSQLPFAPPNSLPNWVLGALGALIAVVEGIQQLNQYHANWIAYRSTCEALKHEKYLYLGQAGPYASAANAHALLAERIESLVSQEHAKWASSRENTEKTHEASGPKP
jgi:hypothetical protein